MSEGQDSRQETPKAKRVKQIPNHPPKRPRELTIATDIRYFQNPFVLKEFQDHCGFRKVFAERQISEKFLEDIQWPYIETLKRFGWWDFLTFDREVYADAVRVFYFNGDNRNRNEEGNIIIGQSRTRFWTNVYGKTIRIDDLRITNTIGEKTQHGEDSIPKRFDYVEACQLIYNKPDLLTIKKTINDLPFHHRILHLIVCQTLTPRLGTYTTVTKDDMYWMSKIILGEEIDLSAWIVARMITCFEACHDAEIKCVLPFGKLISQIIQNKCTIGDFEPEDKFCKMKILNEDFLAEWQKDEESGEYRRKKDIEAEQAAEAARANEAADDAEPSAANILDELRLMHLTNQERFDEVVLALGTISRRQTDIERRQATLETMFKRFSGDI